MLLDQHRPPSENEELNLLPPPELNVSLLRSLLGNVRDRFLPDRLPPLKLSSRPVDVGMLVGDILDVPWYRTVLSSIGDLVSPEILPALQLESQPVDVELISDQPTWWRSLLRNVADALAPERQPALHLTSRPMNPEMASTVLMAPRWSALIDTPKVFRPEPRKTSASADRPVPVATPMRTTFVLLPPLEAADHDFDDVDLKLVLQLKRSIRRSYIRQMIWISIAVAEVIALVVLPLIQH